jgi:hypothetical protein
MKREKPKNHTANSGEKQKSITSQTEYLGVTLSYDNEKSWR